MKIILGNFNEKGGRENIFKPTTGNESGLKQGNALSQLLFSFDVENAIRRVKVNQNGLK
jgi:hypothetical protein